MSDGGPGADDLAAERRWWAEVVETKAAAVDAYTAQVKALTADVDTKQAALQAALLELEEAELARHKAVVTWLATVDAKKAALAAAAVIAARSGPEPGPPQGQEDPRS